MSKDEALRLALEALEKLWNIIDDIDTYSDMAKADEKLYRTLVERRQRQRFEETGISTDGYELHGGAITAIKAALEAKDEPVIDESAAKRIATALEWESKRKPLTIEQLREHWKVAKVFDMTYAEIDIADYVLIARDVEELHGIKGEA
jgi:hypothetical protein